MGAGVVAQYGHLPAVRDTPGLQLVSVFDPSVEQVAKFKCLASDVQIFTDPHAFFKSGIDAVSVLSPAPNHLENVQMAAQYGKHVLCEKPLAMTDADISQMISTMENAHLLLGTAFCYRFSSVSMQIRDLVRSGAIGAVKSLRLIYIWNLHGKYETDSYGNRVESPRRIGRMVEGGPMVDCGVHQIDLSQWWLDSPIVRHHAEAAWVEQYEAPDHVWLHADHQSGAHSMVEMSFSYTHTAHEPINHFSYHLIGTDGLIRYDRDGWYLEMRNSHGTQVLPGSDEKNFHEMYVAWRDALVSGNLGDIPSGRDGLNVTRIARTATDEVIARHKRFQNG
jgi:predicted dehydrogenase